MLTGRPLQITYRDRQSCEIAYALVVCKSSLGVDRVSGLPALRRLGAPIRPWSSRIWKMGPRMTPMDFHEMETSNGENYEPEEYAAPV